MLDRFALERLLYRLSMSPYREQFLLKGAVLFSIWFEQPHRPTRNADFLGFGPPDPDRLAGIVRELCAMLCDDGVQFDPDSVAVEPIREEANYAGLRLQLRALLGNARCHVRWDVGFGDAVTPAPSEMEFPVLLEDLPPPHLRICPRATVFAEKLEALTSLGIANSRMKDYFDLLALIREGALDPATLATAIRATFARRETPLPNGVPFGLTDDFAADARSRGSGMHSSAGTASSHRSWRRWSLKSEPFSSPWRCNPGFRRASPRTTLKAEAGCTSRRPGFLPTPARACQAAIQSTKSK